MFVQLIVESVIVTPLAVLELYIPPYAPVEVVFNVILHPVIVNAPEPLIPLVESLTLIVELEIVVVPVA